MKEKLIKKSSELLQSFFQEENGNRITQNNISWLSVRFVNLFKELYPDEKPKKGEKINDTL